MLRAGAVGYVSKEAAYEELVAAILSVVKVRRFISSPAIVSTLVHSVKNGRRASPRNVLRQTSSMREREILQLIAEGKATKEIALILGVSIKTAETHRRNIMEKLNLDNVAELTKYAIREGLTGV